MNMQVPLTIVLLLVCCVANTLGQTSKRELTVEWVFGPEGRAVASVPTTAWLDDGTLVILDNRRLPAEQTFEKLNPATGQNNVHPYNEMAFIDTLVAAGKKFDMMAYPMRKHGISDDAAQLHLYRLMLDFWKANL
jgi:hypothetical protein